MSSDGKYNPLKAGEEGRQSCPLISIGKAANERTKGDVF